MRMDATTIREADHSDADLGAFVDIANATTPDDPRSLDELRWADATYPGSARFLAVSAGRPVGAASVGRIYMYPPEFDASWATLHVLADARRQGIGSALLMAVSDHARMAGKAALHVPVSDARPDSIGFFVRRGFAEYERSSMVRLDLVDLAPPAIDLPAGVTLTTLAERRDLATEIHAVAVEAFADIPGWGEPTAAGDLAEFLARDVNRPSIPAGAFMIALETATGHVIGYASLLMTPGQARSAWHDMTAVVRAWRGRGLAGALKRATIGWALANSLVALETGNDVDNVAMRAVNARLGYRPMPDQVILRGPLFSGIIDRS